jgi:hypothetical protein
MQKTGLFLLHEGVGSTIFTSQVMEHVACMARNGVDFEVLTFETFRKARAATERNLAQARATYPQANVTLSTAANIYLPGSTLINAFLLLRCLMANRLRLSFIHARADYTAFLALLTRPLHGLPVIWDCRGDAVDELRDSLSRKPWWLRATLGTALLLRMRLIGAVCRRYANGAIFVSDALRAHHGPTLRTDNVAVVPCPVPESKFFFSEEVRATARAEYGVQAGQQVFIYSGSVVAYQGLADQFGLYQRLLEVPQNVIFFATSEPDQARAYFHALPPERFRIVSVAYDRMNDVYNLADFAFMLREAKQLNWVASPTKFGEYCLTGLPVVLNDTVQQACDNARALGNHVALERVMQALPFAAPARQAVATAARALYARQASVPRYQTLYARCDGSAAPVGAGWTDAAHKK